MKGHVRKLPWVLMALGAAMALWALGMLWRTPGVLQYCVLAPEPGEKGEAIAKLAQSARKLGDSMKDTAPWIALGGEAGTVRLSADGASEQASLYAMGEGWLEVYPRFLIRGRRIGESELAQGTRVAMLDEDLAFKLFGGDLPEDAQVKLNDVSYRVVGTVRHAGSLFGGRGVGDAGDYDAYVPLLAAARDGVTLQTLTLSAASGGGSGAARLFDEDVRAQWLDGGQLIDLGKEAMRATILPRILLLVAGLYALVGLFGRMTRLAEGWFADFRRALERSYFNRLIGRLAGIVGLTLLGYAALIAATYLLMAFSVQPLYVFTEWVPENIVEWSSIAKVFWNLVGDAAQTVRLATRELRTVAFWGGLLRWGVIALLLGAALRGRARKQASSVFREAPN